MIVLMRLLNGLAINEADALTALGGIKSWLVALFGFIASSTDYTYTSLI